MITFLNNLDQTILFFIQTNFHFPIIDKIMVLFSTAGDKGVIWILLSFLLLMNKKTRSIGMVTLGVLILSTIMGEGIFKHIFQRPRPYANFPSISLLIDKSSAYSFPSGHTTSSFAVAYVINKYLKRFAPWVWMSAITIAFSRIYLFMHYPSDILAGMILGLLCGKVTTCLYENKIKKKRC